MGVVQSAKWPRVGPAATTSTLLAQVTVVNKPHDDDSVLGCPRCGSEYLHHGQVKVFNRGEDAERVSIAVVDGKLIATAIQLNANSANPSRRRHGLRIRFECEGCDGGLCLCIWQHKGQTLACWEVGR